jgi:hypothetical protein
MQDAISRLADEYAARHFKPGQDGYTLLREGVIMGANAALELVAAGNTYTDPDDGKRYNRPFTTIEIRSLKVKP